jgi:hypothetical protein
MAFAEFHPISSSIEPAKEMFGVLFTEIEE